MNKKITTSILVTGMLILTVGCSSSKWDTAGKESREAVNAVGDATADSTKEGWDKTKQGSEEAWDKTKQGSQEAWDKTKEAVE